METLACPILVHFGCQTLAGCNQELDVWHLLCAYETSHCRSQTKMCYAQAANDILDVAEQDIVGSCT